MISSLKASGLVSSAAQFCPLFSPANLHESSDLSLLRLGQLSAGATGREHSVQPGGRKPPPFTSSYSRLGDLGSLEGQVTLGRLSTSLDNDFPIGSGFS